jgi:cell division protein FtsQ
MMGGAVLLGVYVLWGSWAFKANKGKGEICEGVEVVVQDNVQEQFLTSADVVAIMKSEEVYPVGKTWKEIDTEKLEKTVERHDMVAQAEAFLTLSGKVKVVVTQREPVLRVMGMYGNFYVDRSGKIMPVSVRSTAYLPVACGYVEKEMAIGSLYEIALFLRNDAFWNVQIEQLYVRRDREVEFIPRVGDHRIVLGPPDGFEKKLENLRLFYEQAIPKLGWQKYSVINLKYRGQVVCTRR